MKAFYNQAEKDVGEMLEGILHADLDLLRMGEGEIDIGVPITPCTVSGVETSKEIKSSIGRAKWFFERSLGALEPGAISGYQDFCRLSFGIVIRNARHDYR